MMKLEFTHPDVVGASEYRAIYDCLESGLADCPHEEQTELAAAMLEEFLEHAASMLRQLRRIGTLTVTYFPDRPPTITWPGLPLLDVQVVVGSDSTVTDESADPTLNRSVAAAEVDDAVHGTQRPTLARELSIGDARQVVAEIQEYMFLKDGRWSYHDLSGADFIEAVTLVLSRYGLVPDCVD